MHRKPLSDLFIQGYRDGWEGGKPPLFAPQEWVSGWKAGDTDRRHGWAKKEFEGLGQGPPGSKWTERR